MQMSATLNAAATVIPPMTPPAIADTFDLRGDETEAGPNDGVMEELVREGAMDCVAEGMGVVVVVLAINSGL